MSGRDAVNQHPLASGAVDRATESAAGEIGLADLRGHWRKQTRSACAAIYPEEIAFLEETYRAQRAADQRFSIWDGGMYRLDAPDILVLFTASHELAGYRFVIAGEMLAVTDERGCRVEFARFRPDGAIAAAALPRHAPS